MAETPAGAGRPLPQRIRSRTRDAAIDPVGLPAGLDLPGLDRSWSRVVTAPDAEGTSRRYHVLDNGPLLAERGVPVTATLLCAHGNPTWSYLWRRVIDQAPDGWRVVAVDQLGMGWSERPGHPRTLAQRVDDLDALTTALEITGPVATLAHDWGGAISLGWAQRHTEDLRAVVLTNTGVHQPEDEPRPRAITIARSPALLERVCVTTPAFVSATTALSVPPLPRAVRRAFAAPYRRPARRTAVGDFVRDIPFEADHPSAPTLTAIAEGCRELEVPTLMVWGTRDPVFSARYLEDLLTRIPHADVQRCTDASHLVLEDRPDAVGSIWTWLTELDGRPLDPGSLVEDAVERVPVRVAAADGGDREALAIAEMAADGSVARRISAGELADRVDDVARGLLARGVGPGDRVAVLVPPGIDLTTVVYAVWRLGGVIVVADAGLGLGRLGAALRGAAPRHVIGYDRALTLARLTRVPGQRILVQPGGPQLDALAAEGRERHGSGLGLPPEETLREDLDGAVLFTSGATGPPKGVVYTRGRLGAQIALLRDGIGFSDQERFVAAFAPFALYGPALGMGSVVPAMDVTAPDTLTAGALADAVAAVDATIVFAAPAALRNVVATADELDDAQRHALASPRLVLSAGAPVPAPLLRRVQEILPSARTETPYGMTEALPVATHDPTATADEDRAGTGRGVCVGRPLPGVRVGIAPLDGSGTPAEELTDDVDVTGEIVVTGPHIKHRYDRLWSAQRASDRPRGWHRTGDVGHLDTEGRLWVEGRLAHVVDTGDGPVTPYPLESRIREAVPHLVDVAVVGVGPRGARRPVVVVVPEQRCRGAEPIAPAGLAAAVRRVADVPVAAVLIRDWFPVDVRHASKVDRGALTEWATDLLERRGPRSRLGRALQGSAPRRRSR